MILIDCVKRINAILKKYLLNKKTCHSMSKAHDMLVLERYERNG
jgi:hypothetical protein